MLFCTHFTSMPCSAASRGHQVRAKYPRSSPRCSSRTRKAPARPISSNRIYSSSGPLFLVPKLCLGTPAAKLCFASICSHGLWPAQARARGYKVGDGKQSFPPVRSQADLGNEGGEGRRCASLLGHARQRHWQDKLAPAGAILALLFQDLVSEVPRQKQDVVRHRLQ